MIRRETQSLRLLSVFFIFEGAGVGIWNETNTSVSGDAKRF